MIQKTTDLSPEELESSLKSLAGAELIYERGIIPDTTYRFKHALTRDVIYESILTENRKRLHERIGCAIEELNKKNLNAHAGTLVGHYIEAENWEKGEEICNACWKISGKDGLYS